MIQLLLYIVLEFFDWDLARPPKELTVREAQRLKRVKVPWALIIGNLDAQLGFRVTILLPREEHDKYRRGRGRVRQ